MIVNLRRGSKIYSPSSNDPSFVMLASNTSLFRRLHYLMLDVKLVRSLIVGCVSTNRSQTKIKRSSCFKISGESLS